VFVGADNAAELSSGTADFQAPEGVMLGKHDVIAWLLSSGTADFQAPEGMTLPRPFSVILLGRTLMTTPRALRLPGRRAESGSGIPAGAASSTKEVAIAERVERFGFGSHPIPIGFRIVRTGQRVAARRFTADWPKSLGCEPDSAPEPADLGSGHLDPEHHELREWTLARLGRCVDECPRNHCPAHQPYTYRLPASRALRQQSILIDSVHVPSGRDVVQSQLLR
jgi:hypothetical protein